MSGSILGYGQDIHFTQLNSSPIIINPAFTGVFNGWERVSMNHKNQWLNAGAGFFTTSIAADFNVLKKTDERGSYLGFGLLMYSDVGGDSKFGTKQILTNFSGIVPISEKQIIAVGFQAGLGQKTGSYENLVFSNQFDGQKLNPKLNSFEANGLSSRFYPDLSFGILYKFGGLKRALLHDEEIDLNVGFSMYHFNKPRVSYNFGVIEKLHRKLVFNTSIKKDFSGSSFGFEAMANQFIQGPHTELLVSSALRYRNTTASKVTGMNKNKVYVIGLAYRVNDAISPLLRLEYGPWYFGMSYDITISKLGNFSRSGGFEFSIIFKNSNFALFKRGI